MYNYCGGVSGCALKGSGLRPKESLATLEGSFCIVHCALCIVHCAL